MKKLCFAAICMLIVAGCGDSSPKPDTDANSSTDATAASSDLGTADSAETPANEGEPEEAVEAAKPGSDTKPVAQMPDADAETGEGAAEVSVAAEGNDKESAKHEDVSIADRIAQIEEERTKAMAEFRKWYVAATDEEKEAEFDKHYPDPSPAS